MKDNEESTILVKSIFGTNTRQPLVSLTFNHVDTSKPFTISVEEARALAFNIIGAAEAAEQDAFLISYLTNYAGMPMQKVAGILIHFREQREAKEPLE